MACGAPPCLSCASMSTLYPSLPSQMGQLCSEDNRPTAMFLREHSSGKGIVMHELHCAALRTRLRGGFSPQLMSGFVIGFVAARVLEGLPWWKPGRDNKGDTPVKREEQGPSRPGSSRAVAASSGLRANVPSDSGKFRKLKKKGKGGQQTVRESSSAEGPRSQSLTGDSDLSSSFMPSLPSSFTSMSLASTMSASDMLSSGSLSAVKMVLVVRGDLRMSSGKIASQCAHAAVGSFRALGPGGMLGGWDRNGQAKIVVQASGEKQLRQLQRQCQSAGVHCFMVSDAGRTEVASGSMTVLACGPAPSAALQSITGRLRLL